MSVVLNKLASKMNKQAGIPDAIKAWLSDPENQKLLATYAVPTAAGAGIGGLIGGGKGALIGAGAGGAVGGGLHAAQKYNVGGLGDLTSKLFATNKTYDGPSISYYLDDKGRAKGLWDPMKAYDEIAAEAGRLHALSDKATRRSVEQSQLAEKRKTDPSNYEQHTNVANMYKQKAIDAANRAMALEKVLGRLPVEAPAE